MSKREPAPDAPLLLVVDDDEFTRSLMRDLCESCGYRTQVAEDGAEALAQLEAGGVDLVLLDLMLPRMDGFTVLQELRRRPLGRELPVIIVTAMGDMDGKIRGMELGADDYVTKPFRLVELKTRIQCALQVRDYRRRLQSAEEALAQLRAVDPLTGVGTYSQLKASMDAELARARRFGRTAAVLLFGLDDYSSLRAQLGKEPTDAYVSRFAREVQRVLRAADRLFRIEADEFIALLPEADLKGAHLAAERISRALEDVHVEGGGEPLRLTVRIAGASFPHERVQTSEDLLREAHRVYREMRERAPATRVFAA